MRPGFGPSLLTIVERLKLQSIVTSGGCRVWTGCTRSGRGKIQYRGRVYSVHRLVGILKVGRDLRRDELVMHTCNNPLCIRPSHLVVGTAAENTEYMIACGRAGWQRYRMVPVTLLQKWGIDPDTLQPKEQHAHPKECS